MTFTLPPVLTLGVTFTTTEPQRLPPFLGSALHGALGRALYRTVCAFPKRERCPGCPIFARCAYPALFQTPASAAESLRAAGIRDQAPRPLVLAPEPGWTRPSGNPFRLKCNDDVPVRLTLIGRAIDDLPVVTVALQALARRGLGIPDDDTVATRRRAALALAGVTTADGALVVYDAARDSFTPPPPPPALCDDGSDHAAIELITPLRLKHNGRFVSAVRPLDFFTALGRRANALGLLHARGVEAVDEEAVAQLAAQVSVVDARLRRVHVTRYSATQQARMQWPGLMGTLRWRGDAVRGLWPLLRFGELVQVGKGTALGFGRYRLGDAGKL